MSNGRVMQHVPAAFVRVGDWWPVKERPSDAAALVHTVASVAYDAAAPLARRLLVVTHESRPDGFAFAPDEPVWIMAAPGRVAS